MKDVKNASIQRPKIAKNAFLTSWNSGMWTVWSQTKNPAAGSEKNHFCLLKE